MRSQARSATCASRTRIDSDGRPRDSILQYGEDNLQALLLLFENVQRHVDDAYPPVEMTRRRPLRFSLGHGIPRFINSAFPDVRQVTGEVMDRLDARAHEDMVSGKRRVYVWPAKPLTAADGLPPAGEPAAPPDEPKGD